MLNTFDYLNRRIFSSCLIKEAGKVTRVSGLIIESDGPNVSIGDQVDIYLDQFDRTVKAEVIGIKNKKLLIMPFDLVNGIKFGCYVFSTGENLKVPLSRNLLGRVIDAFGEPLDDLGSINTLNYLSVDSTPINPLARPLIDEQFHTGIKAIDTLIPIGKGQRIGLFAGSGVGKSTLLSMLSQGISADVNVVALVGERGREVKQFVEKHISSEARRKTVFIVATADSSALMRRQATVTATRIAEWFRDEGCSVALLVDSITRYAMALREISLSVGEPPTSRGYTPSVFSSIPRLLERAGTCDGGGSITAIYTVLVEGDDLNEPISDCIRSTVDGHITLSRKYAERGHYPAIDILKSDSRVKCDLVSDIELQDSSKLRKLISIYESNRDMIELGAYKKGSDSELDCLIEIWPELTEFLCQELNTYKKPHESFKELKILKNRYEDAIKVN